MLAVACHSGRFTQRCMGPNSCAVLYSIPACPLVPQWSSNTACHRCNIPHMHAQARSSPLACALHMTDRAVRCCSGCRQSGARARSSAARGARSTGTISAAAYTLLSTAAGTSRRDSRKTFAQGPSAVTAVLPVAPNPISRPHGAIGLYARPQACVLRIMGNSGRMTTRYVELPACSAVQYTWSVNRPTAVRHHRRTCALAWLALAARIWAAHRRVSRWTGWRLSGVRAQSRAAWGSSSAWCASLPSSAFELLLVHPSMSPAQPPRVPMASALYCLQWPDCNVTARDSAFRCCGQSRPAGRRRPLRSTAHYSLVLRPSA
jgi:hypothetical protein